MVRHHTLIAVFIHPLALQTIVLHVVHHFQEETTKGSGDEPTQGGLPTQEHSRGQKQSPLKGLEAEKDIRDMPWGVSLAAHVFGLNLPGRPPGDKNSPEPKHLQPFVSTGGGRIVFGGHVAVVTLVVFDEEMGVQRGHQQGL